MIWDTENHKGEMTDFSELVEAARGGQTNALERLLESYRDYLRLLARRSIDAAVQAKVDSSDLVQEALIRAHAHFGQFRGRSERELAAWLRQILAHYAASAVRRYRIRPSRQVSREVSLEVVMAQGERIATDEPSPTRDAIQRELVRALGKALEALSEEHRRVIVLRSLHEMAWDEVAGKMGRTPDAARMLWSRALKSLRTLMDARV